MRPSRSSVSRYCGGRCVLGHGQEHLLAQGGDLLTEQRRRGLLALGHLGIAVDETGDGPRQRPLRLAPLWLVRREVVELGDAVVFEKGEELDQLDHLLVGCVEKNWYMVKGLVRFGSSQTVPDSVLPYLVPSALTMSGVVKPHTSSPQTRRT